MIVIDASALAKYLLREPNWRAVEEYLAEGVYSVDLVIKEVANAIWKHARLHGMITVDQALLLFGALMRLVEEEVIVLEDERKYMRDALELALSSGVTVYDALYIAQARRLGGLLTSDERQAAAARRLGVETHLVL